MEVGDLVKLHKSGRRNGQDAGKTGLIISLDAWRWPRIIVEGSVKSFHYSQIKEVLNADR